MAGRRGFTLIELLAVMAIVAALGLLVLPRLAGSRARDRVLAQARHVATLTQAARARAAGEGRAYLLVVDPVKGEARLLRRRDPLAAATDPDDPEREPADAAASWSRPVPFPDGVRVFAAERLAEPVATGEPLVVVFHPGGEADAARVVFESAQGDLVTVTIEPATGRTTIVEGEVE
ncbi:MAG: type II secretion system GspH family protein [Planctomycetes bacterium]|nr:type II secretion system GspH family protein [Planctomycetota bacterium]